jgi:hypothetical protein
MHSLSNLRRACLHEHAHLAVARALGASGFVTIACTGRGADGALRYGGRFQMFGELVEGDWRIVALAGAIAECLDGDPSINARAVARRLRLDADALSGRDAELAAGYRQDDVARCLEIVRAAWREIESAACERIAVIQRDGAGALDSIA